MKRLPLLALMCLGILSGSVAAQPNDANKTAPAKNVATNKAAKDLEAERMMRERRSQAQSLLIALAVDAGSYNDLKLRARTQARIADVLWEVDPERSRALFRKAWDAGEMADKEGQRRMQEQMKEQQSRNNNVAVTAPPNLRGEVLRLAARRDRALGEELLEKLRVDRQQEATEVTDRLRSQFDAPEAMAQRLSLARQLLNLGDNERALQFAEPALTAITRQSIDFLSYLREKEGMAAEADRRYAAFLGTAAGSLQADANTVSLLSSYLFTPHVFVAFTNEGATTQSSGRGVTPPDVRPELRAAFFRTASEILLRPLAPAGQDQTTSGVQGKYLMLKRLLPLYEQYSTKEAADAVRATMEALAQAVTPENRQNNEESVREGIRPQDSSEDREKALLDKIDHAKTSAERDRLYMQLASLVSESGDLRARDYVEKIEDMEMRNKVRAYIDPTMALRAVEKKDTEQSLLLVRNGEMTRLMRVWVLTQVAKNLIKTDREKALTLIDEASTESRRIEGSDADRPRALMAVANVVLLSERSKAWDAVYDAEKAANSAEGFTGEDGVIRISLITSGRSSIRSSTAADFDVAGIFAELAKEDYARAVELARGFERESPRATAVIAIARAVLEEKKK